MKASAKVVPLRGKHQSLQSMLAEVMTDPELDRVVVVAYTKDGESKTAVWGMDRADLSFAAGILDRMAFDDLHD